MRGRARAGPLAGAGAGQGEAAFKIVLGAEDRPNKASGIVLSADARIVCNTENLSALARLDNNGCFSPRENLPDNALRGFIGYVHHARPRE